MNIFINISGVFKEEACSLPESLSVGLEGTEGSCCYCSKEAEAVIREAIASLPVQAVHWIDTGDYHYISKFWMEKITEPFVLALFDKHSDDKDSAFGGLLSCGNWVRRAREELPLMKADYLNIRDIPGDLPVYLSIDMDIMPRQFARTDWDQGQKSLDELLSDLGTIASGHRILGVDVCGGLTIAKGAKAEDLSVNSRTRQIIAAYLSSWNITCSQSSRPSKA
ncbi:MAG: hypothetical protein IKH11_03100 [Bacteroidales bacterium]|nr:hypothetical protein [Bacteroidales bacterium]